LRWQWVLVLIAWLLGANSSGFGPAAVAQSTHKSNSAGTKDGSSPVSKRKSAKPITKKKRKRNSPRLRRMRQAFVASASLRPMARQLLQDRTPAAYAGVEAYARRHSKEDAGALAWLVVGYARVLDHDYAKAIDPLNYAKPRAGDLGDYVGYYLANAYLQTGKTAEAIAALADFDKSFPNSLLIRDAHVLYSNALLTEARPQEVIALLEKERQPTRSDVELVLGRAYEAAGQTTRALDILRNIYFTMPLSGEAIEAEFEMKRMAGSAQLPPPTLEQRRTRADLLVNARRFSEAADAYADLQDEVSPAELPTIQLAEVNALHRAGRDKDAKKLLDRIPDSTPDIKAERLFNLGEIARGEDHDDEFLGILNQLRASSPTSPWLEQALLSAGNIYLLRKDYDKAIDSYRESQQRFPSGGRASYAHWKVAWLSFRQQRKDEAKQGFDDQIGLYPTSSQVPAALYWRGRLAEEDGDTTMAQAYYQKLYQRFRNYYYGELARQQLTKIKPSVPRVQPVDVREDPPHYAVLDRVPPIEGAAQIEEQEVPDDNLRVQKAQLLANGALLDFAVKELQAAAQEEKGNWLPAETARLYQDSGRYDMAIEVLKRAVPNYFALDLSSLPRPYWEALFPKPYWPDLKKSSSSNALDPYLVASLIRQESEFNPNAVSRANAVGLMQLLPKVGKGVAKQEKIRHFNSTQLFTPAVNLQLGTRYFRIMVDKFGAFEYALAAYNAGSDRVQDWLGQGKYRDPQEFVESIPFTETREYVQAILRNASVYRQLYGAP